MNGIHLTDQNNGIGFLITFFYGKPFNLKLCTLCLYFGFIFLPVQIYIFNMVFTEICLLIYAFKGVTSRENNQLFELQT